MLQMARPYPDELIASALARGCRHFGVTPTTLARRSMGRDGLTPKFFGMSPLPLYAELFDMPANALLAQHTVLPYATAFSEPSVYRRAVASALAGESASLALGAVIQAAIHGLPVRRFCRECVADDVCTLGESYWHISHQLPGCFVCHRHGTVLQQTELRIAGNLASYDLPQDLKGRPCLPVVPGDAWRAVATKVAELAQRGLVHPQDRTGAVYRNTASRQGWLRTGRDINAARLSEAIAGRFGGKLLGASGVSISTDSASWASLMLHPAPGIPFVTLKHVLLEQFLDSTPVDLSHKPSGPSARPRAEQDKAYATAVQRVAAGYAAAGKRARVVDVLRDAGCWTAYRHRQAGTLPRLSRLARAIQTSEKAFRPQALQMFAVPGSESGEMATRQDLVKAGYLLCSKDAAERLGVHWTAMKTLQREGRILCIRYAARDWYPAFWCEGQIDRQVLEAVNIGLQDSSTEERWGTLVRVHLRLSV